MKTMASVEPAKVIEYTEGEDPKEAVLRELGDALDSFTSMYSNTVLLVTAPTMAKSKGGIIFSDKTKGEERFQGKVGLIVMIGEVAFNDPEIWPDETTCPVVGDWVFYRNADTHECKINGISCRFIKDHLIIGKVSTPDAIR
jgi:co-chaperonin GroES (HSP10)